MISRKYNEQMGNYLAKLAEKSKWGRVMNHDYAHCADYDSSCPKSCFRAALTEDLKNYHYPVSFMNFKGTEECPLKAEGGRLMADTITTTGTGGLYTNYCYNRLPCGVCRIMMCQCPVQNGCGITPVPTWNPTEVTCKAEEENGE